jgi:2'-5' RNA ligase
LAFYGESPNALAEDLAANLTQAANQTPRFELDLAGAGSFRQDVCWIGVTDPAQALGRLAHLVRGSYATAVQHTQNRFHVTVSRSGRKAGLEDAMAALMVYRGPTWTVDHITLFRSDLGEGVGGHPLYTPLAHATLSSHVS